MKKQKTIPTGKPIYRMWSTVVFLPIVLIVYLLLLFVLFDCDVVVDSDFTSMIIGFSFIYLIALILNLTLLHSKPIAYINKKGLHYGRLFIPYVSIKSLHYITGMPPRYGSSGDWYSRLEITAVGCSTVVVHAPRFLQFYLYFKSGKKAKWKLDVSFWFIVITYFTIGILMMLSIS